MATSVQHQQNSINNNNTSVVQHKTNGKSTNNNVISNGNSNLELDPRKLIPELCNHFYHLGWASGTGGGLSIRQNNVIYCAPSGVQKERIRAEDMFVLKEDGLEILEKPSDERLKVSECLSLFMVAFKLRNAGCCIHSHSINANLITSTICTKTKSIDENDNNNNKLIDKNNNNNVERYDEFRISHQEMIKGIKIGSSDKNFNYNDTLIVPIIDNVLYERDLAGSMQEAVIKYPETNAILVRNHGVYVWGKNWTQAKSMAECYDYLFRLRLEAIRFGLCNI